MKSVSRQSRWKRFRLWLQLLPILLIAVIGVVASTQLDQVREIISNASGEPANLQINPTLSYGPITKPWKNLAQGGEMSNWTLEPIRAKVTALEPEYIRIDHIYSFYDVVVIENGQKRYDFTKLDVVVDGILSTGAKPYISLSYMPTQLSDDGTITGKPKNWADWQDLVRATVQHYSGTKGINNVIYEVWNEPDLFGGWKTYGDKNYLELYSYASRGQAQVTNAKPYQFGGPAITALYENWFTRLVEHAQTNNLRLDFFSWHRYNLDLKIFESDTEQAISWRSRYPQQSNLQLHVTEFGHDSRNHDGYDTNYGAAHTVATSIGMTEGIDRAFPFEIEDGKDPAGQERWGRWGMLTHRDFGNNIKPRYQAIRLLNRINGDQVQVMGQGTWVKAMATRNGPIIEVLMTNFDRNGRHVENVPITFQNVGPGSFKLELTELGGQTRTVPLSTESNDLSTELFLGASNVTFARLIPDDGVVPAFLNSAPNTIEPNTELLEVQKETSTPAPSSPFQLEFDAATPVATQSATAELTPAEVLQVPGE